MTKNIRTLHLLLCFLSAKVLLYFRNQSIFSIYFILEITGLQILPLSPSSWQNWKCLNTTNVFNNPEFGWFWKFYWNM